MRCIQPALCLPSPGGLHPSWHTCSSTARVDPLGNGTGVLDTSAGPCQRDHRSAPFGALFREPDLTSAALSFRTSSRGVALLRACHSTHGVAPVARLCAGDQDDPCLRWKSTVSMPWQAWTYPRLLFLPQGLGGLGAPSTPGVLGLPQATIFQSPQGLQRFRPCASTLPSGRGTT